MMLETRQFSLDEAPITKWLFNKDIRTMNIWIRSSKLSPKVAVG